ncbi:uncharacterized protein LOC134649789 [Cydia amplana]|uniref:uncharacterized protein LOC134649789 n=1 Tax=Cydia amplana TaxID=1869771 RepID=UPI002FE54445
MLAIGLAAVLAALFTCCSGASVNYCGSAMCGMSNAHTFCQYTEGPGPKCTGYIDDRLSGEEKTRLIGRMNRRRNEAALGKLQLPAASNMLKLRWVEELAREAQVWADQCNPPSYPEGHDVCRDLYSITVGQCVASVVGEAPGLRPESMVDMWYLQGRQNTIPTDDKNYPMDFAQMLWAHTYLVGCGRSRFMIEQNGRLRTVTRLVCNFAPRGPEGPMWVPGAPASACPARSGPDPVFSGLCTFHHDATFTYNASNTTVLKEQLVLDAILEIEKNDSLNYHGSLDQIYLTKMVAASINNPTEQQYQLDTVEAEIPDYKEVMINDTEDSTITDYNHDNVTTKIVNDSSTARVSKKIFSTVGRPKSYNIEELIVVNKDTENGTANSVPIKEDNIYNDYDFGAVVERNERDYIATMTESSVTTAIPSVVIAETAKELEEALENMEKALASQPVSSKVRRDLRPSQELKDTPEPEQREKEPRPQKELPKELTQTQKLKEIEYSIKVSRKLAKLINFNLHRNGVAERSSSGLKSD